MLRKLKYRFWSWIHDRLESTWHWVYYHGMVPNMEPLPVTHPATYTVISNKEGTSAHITCQVNEGVITSVTILS